jgi:hypothetical protein
VERRAAYDRVRCQGFTSVGVAIRLSIVARCQGGCRAGTRALACRRRRRRRPGAGGGARPGRACTRSIRRANLHGPRRVGRARPRGLGQAGTGCRRRCDVLAVAHRRWLARSCGRTATHRGPEHDPTDGRAGQHDKAKDQPNTDCDLAHARLHRCLLRDQRDCAMVPCGQLSHSYRRWHNAT